MKMIYKLIGPLIFIILSLIEPFENLNQTDMKILGLLIWMAYWWVLETIPLYITALLPLAIIPTFTEISAKTISVGYSHSLVFLVLGGSIFAVALEKTGLSERIALNLINLIGYSKKRIVLSISLTIAFFSMWMSNSASTVTMLPIVINILEKISTKSSKTDTNFIKCLLLCLAHSASIGGMATIIGTPPNAVLISQVKELGGIEISFFQWMKIGVPVSILCLIAMNLLMTNIIFKLDNKPLSQSFKQSIKDRIKEIGKLSYNEKWIIFLFITMVFFWVFKKNTWLIEIIPISKNLTDTAIIMFVAISLFFIRDKQNNTIIQWKETMGKINWGVLLLLGGGIALSAALKKTQVVNWIGDFFSVFGIFPTLAILILLAVSTSFLTEVNSNTATSIVLIPIFWSFANNLGLDPLTVTIVIALSASTAFMLPTATPPNAIIFQDKYLTVKEMAKGGLLLNFTLPVVIAIFIYFFLQIISLN